MACFLVPAAEAVITTVANHILRKKERESDKIKDEKPFSTQLRVLNNMLWGGSGLLAFEHLWHGELKPFFPFLTAASTPAGITAMLHEMATNGIAMALLVTFVWGAWCVLERTKYHAVKRTEDKA